MEELTLTIPQTVIGICVALVVIVAMLRKRSTVRIDFPKEEVKEEEQKWNDCYGAVIQNASVYH